MSGKNGRIKVLTTILGLTLLTSCKVIGVKSSKTAEGGSSDKGYERTRWNANAFPLDVRVAEDFIDTDYNGEDGIGIFTDFLNAWDDEVGLNFFETPIVTTPDLDSDDLDDYEKGVIGIYKSSTWFSNVSSNAIAVTYWLGIKAKDSEGKYYQMTSADIILNYSDWNFKVDNTANNHYFIPQVVLHELGHLLGLEHQTPPFGEEAIMKSTMATSEHLDELQDTDKDAIVALYQNVALTGNTYALTSLDGEKSFYYDDEDEDDSDLGEPVRGMIELMADGKCVHKINDKVVKEHRVAPQLSIFKRHQ